MQHQHTSNGFDGMDDDEIDDLPSIRYIKDPVHDLMAFDPFICSIIDTPQFQRLRHLKQLGTSYFVFPGASHNRFEHSLGTAHLARRAILNIQKKQPKLKITERDVQCVEIAGLCHDLGHGPFSHVFDSMFIPRARPPKPDEEPWTHEVASEMMFDYMIRENDIPLEEDKIRLIKDLIRGEPNLSKDHVPPEKPFLFEIVANKKNGVDVDKLDYIQRDCHAVGESCTLNASRLLEAARVVNNEIVYNYKDSQSLHELFYSRYSLHKRIYNHKTAKAIEHMIVEALLAAEPVYHLSEKIYDPEQYLYLTDSIVEDIERSTDPRLEKSRKIIKDLRCRRIPKRVDEKCLPAHYKPLWKPQLTSKAVAEMSRKLIEEKTKEISPSTLSDDQTHAHQTQSPSPKAPEPPTHTGPRPSSSSRAQKQAGTEIKSSGLLPPFQLQSTTRVTEASAVVPERDPEPEPLTENDVIIDFAVLHFGMKDKDPLDLIRCYGKDNPSLCSAVRPDESGFLRPSNFDELIVRCFSRDSSKRAQVQEAFRKVLESLPSSREGTPSPTEAPSTPPNIETDTSFISSQEPPASPRMGKPIITPHGTQGTAQASPRQSHVRKSSRSTPFATEPNTFTTIPVLKSPKSPSGTKRKRPTNGNDAPSGDEVSGRVQTATLTSRAAPKRRRA